jgi:hypothetical protein
MERQYMYVFVREDLSPPQQIVQAAHASALIGEQYHANTNIVLFGSSSEDELKHHAQYLESHDIEFEMFYEPDISQYTAIATQPLVGVSRKPLRKFKLLN